MTVALPQSFSLGLHAGSRSSDTGNDALSGYEDHRAWLSYTFAGGWTAAAAYTHSMAKDVGYTILGKNTGNDQCMLAISRAF